MSYFNSSHHGLKSHPEIPLFLLSDLCKSDKMHANFCYCKMSIACFVVDE